MHVRLKWLGNGQTWEDWTNNDGEVEWYLSSGQCVATVDSESLGRARVEGQVEGQEETFFVRREAELRVSITLFPKPDDVAIDRK